MEKEQNLETEELPILNNSEELEEGQEVENEIEEEEDTKIVLSSTTETRNLNEIIEPTGNLYNSIAIMAKRSNQINVRMKEELTQKLNEFASTTDNLEEIFENREQIEISRYYEKMPNAPLQSLQEFLNNDTYFRAKEEELKEIKIDTEEIEETEAKTDTDPETETDTKK